MRLRATFAAGTVDGVQEGIQFGLDGLGLDVDSVSCVVRQHEAHFGLQVFPQPGLLGTPMHR